MRTEKPPAASEKKVHALCVLSALWGAVVLQALSHPAKVATDTSTNNRLERKSVGVEILIRLPLSLSGVNTLGAGSHFILPNVES
jgi:hypothetical protein